MSPPTTHDAVADLMHGYYETASQLKIAIAEKASEVWMNKAQAPVSEEVSSYALPRSVQQSQKLHKRLLALRLTTHELLIGAADAALQAGKSGLTTTITLHIDDLNLLLWEAGTRHRKKDGTIDQMMAGARVRAFRSIPAIAEHVSANPTAADLAAHPTAVASAVSDGVDRSEDQTIPNNLAPVTYGEASSVPNPDNQSEEPPTPRCKIWWLVDGVILGLLCLWLAPLLAAAFRDVFEWLAPLLLAPFQEVLEWLDQSRRASSPYIDNSNGRTRYRCCQRC